MLSKTTLMFLDTEFIEERSISLEKVISNCCKTFEVWRIEFFTLKQAFWSQDLISVLYTFLPEQDCNIFSKVCLHKAGFASHMRSHDSKQSQVDYTQGLPQHPTRNMRQFCEKVCGPTADL